MSVDSKAFQQPMHSTGAFTTASSAVDVTETLGYQPSLVIVIEDYLEASAAPNIHIAHSGQLTQSLTLTGATGVITTPVVASGLDITTTGFIARSEIQTDSGENVWIAFR